MVLIGNNFSGGLVTDFRADAAPNNSYFFAQSAVHSTTESLGVGLAREMSDEEIITLEGEVVGASYIDEENATLYFVKDSGNSIYIFYHDTHELKLVGRDSEFCCEWDFSECEWIYAETNKLDPCRETIIYFSSKCVYYRINITEMLDPVRKAALKESICANSEIDCDKYVNDPECQRCKDLTCDYFQLFKGACSPKISAMFNEGGGYAVRAGSYYFAIQLEDNQGNKTNWGWFSDQVNVTSENNIPGEVSTGKIDVMITNVDCKYDKINIAVVSDIDGVVTATELPSRHYNTKTVSFDYYGQKGRDISLEEIVTKRKQFIRGKDLLGKDGRLWLYNIKPEINVDYQRRAFQANVYWVSYETTATSAKKYHYPSLMRDENYLFGIILQYIDNTHSGVFLLEPGGECGTEPTVLSNLDTGSPVRGFTQTMTEGKCIRCRGNGSGSCGITSGCAGGVCGGGADNGTSFAPGDPNYPANPNDPNEDGSDIAEDAIDNWDTDSEAFTRAAACNDCGEDEIASDNDLSDYELFTAKWLNEISEAGLDKDNPDLNKASTFKDAAKFIVTDAVKKAEFKKYEAAEVTSSNPAEIGPSGTGDVPTSDDPDGPISSPDSSTSSTPKLRTTTKQNHAQISGEGENIAEELPRAVQWGRFGTKCSSIVYPDAKNCEGEYIFGDLAKNTPIKLFKTPTLDQAPIMRSDVMGVVSKHTPDNNEFDNTYVRHLGIMIDNIQLPDEDELPKPLCPHQPYRIVMVPRDRLNSTVIAKGISTNCFLGSVRGRQYYFPRNGVNSVCTVDRMVDVGGSHLSTDVGNDFLHYNFHSLDTRTEQLGLGVHTVKTEACIYGAGWMHGLYAKGVEPNDKMYGKRVDQRGYRAAVNLNQIDSGVQDESELTGITYAPANTVVNNPEGIDHPLMNMYRESSVYYKVASPLPPLLENSWDGTDGTRTDSSFFTSTADHFGPINGVSAWYTSLKREIPDQYGSVEGMRFIDTGLVAHRRSRSVQGLLGDVFVGPDTFVRKSYVSNKVGPEEGWLTDGERRRNVCDIPEDKLFELTGINYYPSRLPETGDQADPKNWAGGYEFDRHTTVHRAKANAREDFYYPRVQKTLITYWGEFKYNPWTRQTGPGAQKDLGNVYYPALKDMYLDSDAPMQHPWEESFLNKFYCAVEQPSRAQILRKALVKNIITIMFPALGIHTLTDLESYVDTTGFFVGLPVLIALWWLVNKVLSRDDYLDRLLGFPICKTDDGGGQFDDDIRDFKDNYDRNSRSFSRDGGYDAFHAPTFPYNTCKCNDCLAGQTTNEVFFSSKHRPGMIVDAYKNFNSLDFTQLPNAKGQLKKLFVVGNNMYAHTTEAIFLMKYGALQASTNLGSALLGGNELMIDPQEMVEAVPEGFAGLQDSNSAINTVAGYFFIDRKAKRIYRFNGQLEEISAKGNYHWFKKNLDFCDIGDCFDEKVEGSSFYSLGWDNRLNRLLVTKNDQGGNSWTLSYVMDGNGRWVSSHAYTPRFYIWDRDSMYSVDGSTIYKHHKEGSYGTFRGEKSPMYVRFSAKHENGLVYEYDASEIWSYAEMFDQGWVKDLDISFDQIAVYNSTQGSGMFATDIISDNYSADENTFSRVEEKSGFVKLFKENRRWNINALHDNRKRDCLNLPILLEPSCVPFPVFNKDIFDPNATNSSGYKGQRLSDSYLMYDMSFDGDERVNLILKQVITKTGDLDNPNI